MSNRRKAPAITIGRRLISSKNDPGKKRKGFSCLFRECVDHELNQRNISPNTTPIGVEDG